MSNPKAEKNAMPESKPEKVEPVTIRLGVDAYLHITSDCKEPNCTMHKKSKKPEQPGRERLIPWSNDLTSEGIDRLLNSLRRLANGEPLRIIWPDGIAKDIRPNSVNGLLNPLAGRPITAATILDGGARGIGIMHNGQMRKLMREEHHPNEKRSKGGSAKTLRVEKNINLS